MSQPPTPNMGLILPTDHGDSDVWDVILDTAFGLIDAHDHTPGKGVLVPVGALNVNADVSWSASGTSRAITDLRALDFTAVAAATVTSLANAFFANSADNNLYWRNSSGTNIQVTNGAALNVAAFAGGIGGDYTAVGALELFDDATDSYWFQQQLGAGVRQYARMRSADVDLYEFKAHPTAGVPTNRVRLASPAALAASYALTMPPALGATTRALLQVQSSTGIMSMQSTMIMFSAAGAQPALGTPTAVFSAASARWLLGSAGASVVLPVTTPQGAVFSLWTVYLNKSSSAAGTLSAILYQYNMLTGVSTQIGGVQSSTANSPGQIQFTGASTGVPADCSHYILVSQTGGVASDSMLGWSINV